MLPGAMDPGASGEAPPFMEGYPKPVKRRRFGEPFKFIPIAFVLFTIVALYVIYVFCHCVPMLQLYRPASAVDLLARERAQTQLAIFHFLTVMLLICYFRSVLVHPGQIPDNDPQWEYLPQDARGPQEPIPLSVQETKKSGERRHCKWCGKFKPDRCHHCRVCKTCILKMDHHCPWIYNCVGFGNHKFFFLLLFYSAIACHTIMWTMPASLKAATTPETPFFKMFLLLFGETLAVFLGLMVTLFLCFHIWLMLKAMTTIEFCEKSMKRTGYDSNAYDRGLYGNIRAVLGEYALLWLVPCSPPAGDGFVFINEEAPLLQSRSRDMEAGRDMRKKMYETGRKKGGMAGTGESVGSSSDNDNDPARPFEELRPRNSRYES